MRGLLLVNTKDHNINQRVEVRVFAVTTDTTCSYITGFH